MPSVFSKKRKCAVNSIKILLTFLPTYLIYSFQFKRLISPKLHYLKLNKIWRLYWLSFTILYGDCLEHLSSLQHVKLFRLTVHAANSWVRPALNACLPVIYSSISSLSRHWKRKWITEHPVLMFTLWFCFSFATHADPVVLRYSRSKASNFNHWRRLLTAFTPPDLSHFI
jgi:hypothetical protein